MAGSSPRRSPVTRGRSTARSSTSSANPASWTTWPASPRTGFSDPTIDGGFWAYFHHPAELRDELDAAGFVDVSLLAVEGFAWLLADLPERMTEPDALLDAVRLTETDESMLGVSAHVMAVATAPEPVVEGRRLASASRHPSSGNGGT